MFHRFWHVTCWKRECMKRFGLIILLALVAPLPLLAHTGTWNVNSDGTWETATNWNPNTTFPGDNGTADDATFGNIITADVTVTHSTTLSINSITFNDDNQYTITGGQLRLFSSGTQFNQNGNGTVVIGSSFLLQQNSNTFGGTGSGAVSFNGVIDGANPKDLAFAGSYTSNLNAANTYQGDTTITAGTVNLNAANAMGSTASITVNTPGTLLINASNAINNSAPITLGGGTLTQANGVSDTVGALTLTANSTINLGTSGTLTFANTTAPGSTLTITGWTGNPYTSGTGAQIFFNSSMSTQILAGIQFAGYVPGAYVLSTGEVVPVPEPSTMIAGGLAALGLGWRRLRARRRTEPAV